MEKKTRLTLRLGQLETAALFAAMLIALAVEGTCVYWLRSTLRPADPVRALSSGPWTAQTLPQCWLLGAVIVLLYRGVIILAQPQNSIQSPPHRRAFVRLWGWTVAVGSAQILAIYLERLRWGGL